MLLLALAAGGCAETQLVAHTAKQVARATDQVAEPEYKVGAPYQVDGVWYYPKADYEYSETGIASWYGPGFDGRITANGEIYDQDELTAAHPTLPMPSMVRVTNLDNGRSIKVRINDRGPFKNGRIIDLSRRAADLLDFRHRGTAKVRVEIVEDESRRLAAAALRGEAARTAPEAAPMVPVSEAPLHASGAPPGADNGALNGAAPAATPAALAVAAANGHVRPAPPVPRPDGMVTSLPVQPSRIFVQAGAFTRVDNAIRLRARLSSLGEARISPTLVESRRFYRVRFGPMGSVEDADRLLAILLSNGHSDARVVVD